MGQWKRLPNCYVGDIRSLNRYKLTVNNNKNIVFFIEYCDYNIVLSFHFIPYDLGIV